jgi:nitrite reductase/ring-hydroxylating ferredoxin subunit
MLMAEMIRVAQLVQLRDEEPLCIEHEGVPYCLVKVEGQIRAYLSICTHKDQAMFPPKMKKGLLVCPHHKVAFDPETGEVADDRGKKVDALLPVRIEIVDDVIHLEARKRHRKLVPRRERRWVERLWEKLEEKRKSGL